MFLVHAGLWSHGMLLVTHKHFTTSDDRSFNIVYVTLLTPCRQPVIWRASGRPLTMQWTATLRKRLHEMELNKGENRGKTTHLYAPKHSTFCYIVV